MKNLIAVIAILLIASVGYGQNQKDVELNKETNLFEATYYHENGEISQTGTFNLAGKLHGDWMSFDNEGNKVSEGTYNQGVRTGKWYFWSDGQVKEVEFDNNVIASVINKEGKAPVVTKD
ncbi:toxin-antitoxin system YwqK family antitoxin [Pareuzebyella sediminis]|uniref:toxin-antitoxin system YwqK family antitoxin n=1 Tax=Pareuzebyella sediminis TaxID=2607998 RepID=UPI0011ED80B0|nr:nicotinic acid mononucleotide adenyltransferase [Pareuzebyella sediminis]